MHADDKPHQPSSNPPQTDNQEGPNQTFPKGDLLSPWLDGAPLALMGIERENYTIKLANALAGQLWGRPHRDLIGKPLQEVLPELEGEGIRERLAKVFQTGQPYVGEELATQVNREGVPQTVYFKFIYHPIHSTEGSIVGVTITALDISGEVLQRKALEAKTKQIEQILNGIPQMAWTADHQGIHTFFNETWYIFTGTVSEPVTTTWQAHIHPQDLDQTLALWQACVSKREPFQAQYRLRNKQGQYRWMLAQALPNFDEQGHFRQWIGTCTDIEEQRRALEQVHQQSTHLRVLLDHNPDVITRWDKELKLIYANAAFELKTGQPLASFLGKTNLEMGQALQVASPWMEALQKVIRTAKPTDHYNSFPSPEGETHFYSRLVPEFAPDGSLQSVLAIARDISELKKAKSELDQAFFELDNFVYRASHDIMAPLKSILGLVNILQLTTDRGEIETYLHLIKRSIQKLDTFISDLTNYSRNSRLPLQLVPLNVAALVEEIVEELSYMPGADRVKVLVETELEVPFYSDPLRMKIILQNFISNAYKYQNYSIDNPFLLIKLSSQLHRVTLSIEDNGKGIREEVVGKIFDMFYRASEDSFGSGLGLYIVKQVIDKLGGSIVGVESRLGQGTQFTIVLPNQAAYADPASE